MTLVLTSTSELPSEWVVASSTAFQDIPHSLYTTRYGWNLSRESTGWTVYDPHGAMWAQAHTSALHPTTIMKEEWNRDGVIFRHHPSIFTTSEDAPIDLIDLGLDFFVRGPRLTRIIWFRDLQGEVHHSGAKSNKQSVYGKRYCFICNALYSANNFVSQHLRHCPKLMRMEGEKEEVSLVDGWVSGEVTEEEDEKEVSLIDTWMSGKEEPEDEFSLYLAGP